MNTTVRCTHCMRALQVDFGECLTKTGWPECHGETMEIVDHPRRIAQAIREAMNPRAESVTAIKKALGFSS